jgi:hypothetical protein
LEANKILLNKTNFILYSNNAFKKKQGLEILNLYFKDIPYYLLFTDLTQKENIEKMMYFMNILKNEINNNNNIFNENFAFVVIDNKKVKYSHI